jgi:hypothetical protein
MVRRPGDVFGNFRIFDVLIDFDDHLVDPNGRLGAARTPSSGIWDLKQPGD